MKLNKLKAKIFSNMGEPASIFGVALMEYMKEDDKVIVLSSDVSNYAGLDKCRYCRTKYDRNSRWLCKRRL